MKFLVCLMVLALMLCLTTSAMALYVEKYEMDNDVTTAAGTTNGNVMGLNSAVGSGMTYAGGIGTFLDNTSSGNYGVSLTGAAALAVVGTGGYTVDMRVKWDGAATAGNDSRKTLGFSGNNGNGRGIRIESWGIWYVSAASGVSAGINLGAWQDLRIVVNADGSQAVYDLTDENGWWGDANHKLIEVAPDNSNGVPGASGGNPILSLGNYAGGTTTYAGVQYEYVRIAQGTDPLADHNVTPEPGSMLALGSGLIAMAGLALRRRRA